MSSEDVPKELRVRPWASTNPQEWADIGARLRREKLPVGWETSSSPQIAVALKAPERKVHQDIYTADGRKHIVTMPQPARRVTTVPVTAGAMTSVEHHIYGLATAIPNQIAPCVPDVTEPQPGLICGECETDVKTDGVDQTQRVAKCETYPLNFQKCITDLLGRQTNPTLKDKVEVALACSEKPLPPSIAAHAVDANREDAYDALDDLVAEGKASKKTVAPDEMSFVEKDVPHPGFWFGEVKYYLDPQRKTVLLK